MWCPTCQCYHFDDRCPDQRRIDLSSTRYSPAPRSTRQRVCTLCGGTGRVTRRTPVEFDAADGRMISRTDSVPCHACDGTGIIER